jgi:hypothetical protein
MRPRAIAAAVPVEPATQIPQSQRPTSPVNAVVRNGATQKPIDLIGDIAASSEEPVVPSPQPATRPAPQAAAPEESAPVNSVAHVQLSSQQSAAGAQASASSLQKRFGNLLNGTRLQVVKADLGARGTYYRVVVPAASFSAAQQLCTSIKSNGGDCVAANG